MILMVVGITIGLLTGVFITALMANPMNSYSKGYEDAVEDIQSKYKVVRSC